MTDIFTPIMTLFKTAVIAGGGFMFVWGAIQLGEALHNKEAPGIQNGVWRMIGGAIVCAAGIVFASIDLNFTV